MSTMLNVFHELRKADFTCDSGTIEDAVCEEYRARELDFVTEVAREAGGNLSESPWRVPLHTTLSAHAERKFEEFMVWLRESRLVTA